jgi:hypothetical protein
MSFYDVGCLSTEDRKFIIDVIVNIKNQEKEAMEKATKSSSSPPARPPAPQKYSSLSKSRIPKFPRR